MPISHAQAEQPLLAWHAEASKANWKTPQNIKDQYASASFVGRNRVVFNIKGNDFRLIVAVAYQIGVVYVKFVGTHAEYGKVDAATVEPDTVGHLFPTSSSVRRADIRHDMAFKRLLLGTLGAITLVGCLYLAVPAALLHWRLDGLIFTSQTHDITHESRCYEISVGNAASIVVRDYGGGGGLCVFFFPGQHGGISTYERTLFPYLLEVGTTIYSVSYPGQDGAGGRGSLAPLADQVESAVRIVAHRVNCNLGQSVFVGRSLGATVALVEAERIRPAGA